VAAAPNTGIGVAWALRPRVPAGTDVRLVHDVDDLVSSWEALADRASSSPFAHPGWVLAWSDGFSKRERLSLVAVWREHELVAVLPVETRGRRAVSPTNWHTPAFTTAAADAAAVETAVAALVPAVAGRARLSFVPEDDPIVAVLSSPDGHHHSRRVLQRSPHVSVGGTWDAYLAQRSPNLRGDLRRRFRRLEELGPETFFHRL